MQADPDWRVPFVAAGARGPPTQRDGPFPTHARRSHSRLHAATHLHCPRAGAQIHRKRGQSTQQQERSSEGAASSADAHHSSLFLCSLLCGVQGSAELLSLASSAFPAHLSSLRAASPYLRRMAVGVSSSQAVAAVDRLCLLFEDNDSRDEDDRRRFEMLYGRHTWLDHRVSNNPTAPAAHPLSCARTLSVRVVRFLLLHFSHLCTCVLSLQFHGLYDCVLDTSANQADDTFKQAIAAISSRKGTATSAAEWASTHMHSRL